MFLNLGHFKRNYKLILQGFIPDQNSDYVSFADNGNDEVLKNVRVVGSICYVQPFVKRVIYEFYANFNRGITIKTRKYYHKVFVRGRWFKFGLE